jgi:hypothetical protein
LYLGFGGLCVTYNFGFQSSVTSYKRFSWNFWAFLAVALFNVSVRQKKELGEYKKAADLPAAGKHIITVYLFIPLNFYHEDGRYNVNRNFGKI